MKVWKMVFLQVVTTTPAPAEWNFLHFIIASFQTLPQSLFAAGRSRDRIGEKGWGKTCPKDYESLNLSQKNAHIQNANHQLLQTVTLSISPTWRSQNFALKRSLIMGSPFEVYLATFPTWARGTRPEDPAHQANCNCLRR